MTTGLYLDNTSTQLYVDNTNSTGKIILKLGSTDVNTIFEVQDSNGTVLFYVKGDGSYTTTGGSSSILLSISTLPFPIHKDEISFSDRKPLVCWLQTIGLGLKFNKGKIYLTDDGGDIDLQLAIFILTGSATFDNYSTYDNSTKIVESNSVTWTSNSGPNNNGEGFVEFTFSETTLNTTGHYFVGLYNDFSGTAPKYLGYKDAGDPAKSLDNLFYRGNSNESSPGSTLQNSINTSAKGDPPYICLYYT